MPFKTIKMERFVLLLVTLLAAVSNAQDTVPSNTPPSIVFMMVDDWGWANVGYHRDPPTKEVDTPNFDSLKQQGLELDQHYVYQFCSPSRSSFLSGRLPVHINDENKQMSTYNPDDPISGFAGIPRNMTVIASKLKKAGYATHQVGKWHAGAATSDHIPTGRGFDSSFGYFNFANDYFTKIDADKCPNTTIVDLWDTNKPAHGVNGTGQDHYEEDLFHSRVLDVIENHDTSTPLFLYYAAHIAHGPLEITDKYLNMYSFVNDTAQQRYHAMIKYLDDVLGSIVKALTKRKMWDNLLFVVSADNGGPIGGGANNFPLKGGKFSDWQGGVRVNAFVSGGYLPEKMRGQKTEGYIHIADWYSTFCALAGVDPTDDKAAKAKLPPIDSLNMWPLISGQNSTSPRTDIPVSNFTLISGDYKILTGDIESATWGGPFSPNKTNPGRYTIQHCGNGCLYNIMDDPTEHKNLAMSEPAKLKEMQDKLAQYQATHFNPDRGKKWPAACTTAMDQYGGFWGPFVT